MFKKRFYDFLTIIFVILVILSLSLSQKILISQFINYSFQMDQIPSGILLLQYLPWIIVFIYWLFILVLAINLHKKELTKTVDLVFIIIFSPLAIIFYLTNLRGTLKKYERGYHSQNTFQEGY